MAKLPEALDATLRARYMGGEIRRPITHKQGLTARMNALERHFTQKGDRRGAATKRVAAYLGITPRTWQRWRDGSRKANLPKVEGAVNRLITLPRMRARLKSLPPPNSVTVDAVVIWNGYKNRTEQRSVTLGSMRPVMARVIRVWATAGPQAAAQLFERGAAAEHNVPSIVFGGDDVTVSIPWES
jgi:hypothetical protein